MGKNDIFIVNSIRTLALYNTLIKILIFVQLYDTYA
jgi:hypothetical protein